MYSEPGLHITDAHESNSFLVERRHQKVFTCTEPCTHFSFPVYWFLLALMTQWYRLRSANGCAPVRAMALPGDACWRNADAVACCPPPPRFSDDCSTFDVNGPRLPLVQTLCFSLRKHPSSKLPVLSCRRSSAVCFSAVCCAAVAEPWECCQVK